MVYRVRYNNTNPSICANINNQIFILFDAPSTIQVGGYNVIKMLSYNGTWSAVSEVTTNVGANATYPATISNILESSSPLFIYKAPTKVGFYGTWTTTTISVSEGSIGTKDNKDNVLSYSITTDGTMSTITEKVNGVVIGTKNATSGQSLIVGLTQAQWDAIKFGKYADVTGGLNTLTVEMGTKKWTYTFDKRVATNADIEQAMKAVQDTQDTFLPSIKSMLVDKVGGVDTDKFEDIINNSTSKKYATGTTSSDSSANLTVTGLTFKARIILGYTSPGKLFIYNGDDGHQNYIKLANQDGSAYTNNALKTTVTINNTGFVIPCYSASTSYIWWAFE